MWLIPAHFICENTNKFIQLHVLVHFKPSSGCTQLHSDKYIWTLCAIYGQILGLTNMSYIACSNALISTIMGYKRTPIMMAYQTSWVFMFKELYS